MQKLCNILLPHHLIKYNNCYSSISQPSIAQLVERWTVVQMTVIHRSLVRLRFEGRLLLSILSIYWKYVFNSFLWRKKIFILHVVYFTHDITAWSSQRGLKINHKNNDNPTLTDLESGWYRYIVCYKPTIKSKSTFRRNLIRINCCKQKSPDMAV